MPVNYVLDGQQRLATIFAAFWNEREFEEEDGTYAVDPELFNLSFRFDDEAFIPSELTETARPSIPLSCLFDTEALFAQLENLSADHQKAEKSLFSRLNNYELPVVTISKRSKDEVGVIFERINSTATMLTTLDLLIAWTWSEDFHLQEAINELREILDAKGFGDLPDRIILQSLAAILKESTRTKTILSLEPSEVQRRFPGVGEAMAHAVDFLSTEFRVQSLDFLPHLQQLVGLSFFYGQRESPSAEQASTLRKWFWKTAFSKRYSAQTDEKMDADLVFMKALCADDHSKLAGYSPEVDRTILLKQKLSKSNPYTRAFLLLLAQRSPLDLINGIRIDLGEALSSYNRKEYHHIFPRAFLKRRGLPAERINNLCNFTFLPAGSNKRISQKEPADYIINSVPENQRREIFESNLMPLRLEIYKENNYEEFQKQRGGFDYSVL